MLGNAHSVLALLFGNFSGNSIFCPFLFAIFRNYLFGTSAISQAPLNESRGEYSCMFLFVAMDLIHSKCPLAPFAQ